MRDDLEFFGHRDIPCNQHIALIVAEPALYSGDDPLIVIAKRHKG